MRKRQGLAVFARGPLKDSGSAPKDLYLWELCFSLVSPLWELCSSPSPSLSRSLFLSFSFPLPFFSFSFSLPFSFALFFCFLFFEGTACTVYFRDVRDDTANCNQLYLHWNKEKFSFLAHEFVYSDVNNFLVCSLAEIFAFLLPRCPPASDSRGY